jgi:hypothetical protein
MDLREMWWGGVCGLDSSGSGQGAFLNTVMNLWVP